MTGREEDASKSAPVTQPLSPSGEDIQRRLTSHLAGMRGLEPMDVDITKPYSYYGLSSLEIVLLASDLEEWLGHPLDATLLWDYPTIESLANYLATEHLK